MADRIWKYPLEMTGSQSVKMPPGAVILCVQTQGLRPCLWAQVDPDATVEDRTIEIYGTGYGLPQEGARRYIGTFQLANGDFVFHAFEAEPAP